jgi:hypothetical protein
LKKTGVAAANSNENTNVTSTRMMKNATTNSPYIEHSNNCSSSSTRMESDDTGNGNDEDNDDVKNNVPQQQRKYSIQSNTNPTRIHHYGGSNRTIDGIMRGRGNRIIINNNQQQQEGGGGSINNNNGTDDTTTTTIPTSSKTVQHIPILSRHTAGKLSVMDDLNFPGVNASGQLRISIPKTMTVTNELGGLKRTMSSSTSKRGNSKSLDDDDDDDGVESDSDGSLFELSSKQSRKAAVVGKNNSSENLTEMTATRPTTGTTTRLAPKRQATLKRKQYVLEEDNDDDDDVNDDESTNNNNNEDDITKESIGVPKQPSKRSKKGEKLSQSQPTTSGRSVQRRGTSSTKISDSFSTAVKSKSLVNKARTPRSLATGTTVMEKIDDIEFFVGDDDDDEEEEESLHDSLSVIDSDKDENQDLMKRPSAVALMRTKQLLPSNNHSTAAKRTRSSNDRKNRLTAHTKIKTKQKGYDDDDDSIDYADGDDAVLKEIILSDDDDQEDSGISLSQQQGRRSLPRRSSVSKKLSYKEREEEEDDEEENNDEENKDVDDDERDGSVGNDDGSDHNKNGRRGGKTKTATKDNAKKEKVGVAVRKRNPSKALGTSNGKSGVGDKKQVNSTNTSSKQKKITTPTTSSCASTSTKMIQSRLKSPPPTTTTATNLLSSVSTPPSGIHRSPFRSRRKVPSSVSPSIGVSSSKKSYQSPARRVVDLTQDDEFKFG